MWSRSSADRTSAHSMHEVRNLSDEALDQVSGGDKSAPHVSEIKLTKQVDCASQLIFR